MSSVRVRCLRVVLSTLLSVLTGAAIIAAPASAQAPFRLPTEIVDPAGVLDPAQQSRVEESVEQLQRDRDISYWVVFVDSFDGLDPDVWTARSVAQSEFGAHDVVFATAVDTGQISVQAPIEIAELSDVEIDRLTAEAQALVADDRYADAAVLVGEEVSEATGQQATWYWWLAGIVASVLVLCAVFVYIADRRRNRDTSAALTAEELGQQPVSELEPWSRDALTATFRAVLASDDEVTRAVDEVGAVASSFREAVGEARGLLATAFTVRQRLDDGVIPETDRRSSLVEIIMTCADADRLLDRRVADFDSLRDLSENAPRRLARLAAEIAEARERIPEARERIDGFSVVPDEFEFNADLAEALLDFATDCVEQGRDAVDSGSVIGAIRSAEGAVDQAVSLLDAVDDGDIPIESTSLPHVIHRVSAVSAYIRNRRGVIGSVALTRLSEARRLADAAADLAVTDVESSRGTAARASTLAEDAMLTARAETAEWRRANDAQILDADSAPIIAGVLVDSVLTGDVHPGGYTHDGRSPASYGGSTTSGRIGVGGRR